LGANIQRLISNYTSELERKKEQGYSGEVDRYVKNDPKDYSWTRALKTDFSREKPLSFSDGQIVPLHYRPFTKQWQYFGRRLNEMVYQMPRIFPTATAENLIIQASGIGARSGFSVLMSNVLTSLDTIEKGQCFPLYQ
jgi:predicted helicase